MFSILITVLCCGLAIVLVNIEQGNSLQSAIKRIPEGLSADDKLLVKNIYEVASQQIRTFTLNYIYVLGSCATFAIYTQFFSLLIIAEGKQLFVVIVAIACNGLNLFLD
jgi:Na+-driven multidrug efflux pump